MLCFQQLIIWMVENASHQQLILMKILHLYKNKGQLFRESAEESCRNDWLFRYYFATLRGLASHCSMQFQRTPGLGAKSN